MLASAFMPLANAVDTSRGAARRANALAEVGEIGRHAGNIGVLQPAALGLVDGGKRQREEIRAPRRRQRPKFAVARAALQQRPVASRGVEQGEEDASELVRGPRSYSLVRRWCGVGIARFAALHGRGNGGWRRRAEHPTICGPPSSRRAARREFTAQLRHSCERRKYGGRKPAAPCHHAPPHAATHCDNRSANPSHPPPTPAADQPCAATSSASALSTSC